MAGFSQTDAGLLLAANAFSSQATATPTAFGFSTSQATSLASKVDVYSLALNVSTNESTRTKGTVAAKNSARQILRAELQMLAAVARAHPGITDQQLEDLGLSPRDRHPSPVPPPGLAPLMTLISVTGRQARYKLVDASAPTSRRRPINARGATIMSYVGTTPPPEGDAGWKLEGQTGKTTFVIQFPNDVAPGTTCWATAVWYNGRGQFSPACPPVQTYLQVGPVAEAA